ERSDDHQPGQSQSRQSAAMHRQSDAAFHLGAGNWSHGGRLVQGLWAGTVGFVAGAGGAWAAGALVVGVAAGFFAGVAGDLTAGAGVVGVFVGFFAGVTGGL